MRTILAGLIGLSLLSAAHAAGERRMFVLRGIRGQAIYVDPASRLVMVHTAVQRQPRDMAGIREMTALWRGLLQQLGH